MSELTDYDQGELKPVENAQHRLLWTERLHGKAQRKVWTLWLLQILPGAMTVLTGLLGIWAFLNHRG